MGNNQRNARIILMGEDDDAETIIQLDFAPRNVGRTERTISVEPLVDAPIVPVKSAEPKTQFHAQNDTQEINFVPLLFAGIMIGSICFSGGYILGRESTLNQGRMERAK